MKKHFVMNYSAIFSTGNTIHSQYRIEASSEEEAVNSLVSYLFSMSPIRKLDIQAVFER